MVLSSAGLMVVTARLEPDHPLRTKAGTLGTFSNALLRFWRDLYCTVRIVADYEMTLRNVEGAERERALSEVHLRSAVRLRELMRSNAGVYIKFGQHLAQMQHLLPDEYVLTMQPMLNQAPTSSLAEVERVFREDLNCLPSDVFETFDPVPVASASLAQVHFATLKRASPSDPVQRVAVKVQHAALQQNCDSDIATVRFIIELVHRFDPRFDYQWLADEMSVSLPQECNFVNEARNSERARANLRCDTRADVNVPRIHWPLTSQRVLTMERMDGCIVTDVQSLEKMGIDKKEVSSLLSQVFSEMIFMHGWVHCDPHAGNVLVQRRSATDARPRLILLDHGLYRELDDKFRLSYAHLWQSLIKGDREGIRQYAGEMNAGDMYSLFASMLTRKSFEDITQQRPSGDMGRLVLRNDDTDKLAIQSWMEEHGEAVQTMLSRVPRALLLLLKTNDCLRAIDTQLNTPINSFIIMARWCTLAIHEDRIKKSRSRGGMGFRAWIVAQWELLSMDLRVRLYSFLIALAAKLHEIRRAIQPGLDTPAFVQRPTVAFSDQLTKKVAVVA